MFFLASATIADRHQDLREQVAALDDYLQANEGHTFRLGHAARILHLDADLVRRLLENYEAEGAVKREIAYICPVCDGFLERVPGEGGLWCDICEESVTYRGRTEIGEKAWRTVVGTAKTDYTLLEGDNAAGDEKVVIQFIAGDRGGGPRAQLQTPREARKIKEAVALGVGHESFDFAHPEFAASVDDVIACHQRRPKIVHFAGHGEERQMVLVRDRDPLVEMMYLHQDQAEVLFRNFPDRVRLVVFNTCHSVGLGRHLVEKDVVDMVIGIEGNIPDDHAVRFAATFYRQIADGRSAQVAFELAGIHVSDLEVASRPQLLHAADVNPAAEVFCCPRA